MKFEKIDEKMFDFYAEFGTLKFIGLRVESRVQDEDGEYTEVRKRVYNLLSDVKKAVVQVSIPAEVDEKSFERNQPVRLVEPEYRFMPVRDYPDVNVVSYLQAKDIVPVGDGGRGKPNTPEPHPINPADKDKKAP